MKKSALFFAASKGRAYAVASVLMDIKRLSPDLADEAVIVHDGINANDQRILQSLYPCRFILYKFPIDKKLLFKNKSVRYFTVMVFAKFEAFKLLNQYKYIIVLDYDLVIQGDLSELLQSNTSGFVTTDKTASLKNFFTQPISGFDMEAESRIGSVWVLWDSIRNFDGIYDWCYNKSEQLASSLYLPETGIISLALQTYKIAPDQVLPAEQYDCHPNDQDYANNAKILHCYGQPKYWNGLFSEQWEHNYADWLHFGGTPCYERALLFRLLIKAKKLVNKRAPRLISLWKIVQG